MVVAKTMNKPVLKVSVDSESDSTSEEESEVSENEVEDESEAVDDEGDVDNDEDDEEVDNEDEEVDDVDEGIDGDDESDASEEDGKTSLVTNEGWADSVAKILGSSKPKNKKTLVLSRAKKHAEIVKTVKEEKPAFEVIGEGGEKKPVVKKEEPVTLEPPPAKKVKHEKASIRVKPNVLEKDRERLLNKIATKGVVQLFNAVRNQQKTLEKEMDRNDLSEGKKEKILKKFDKRSFLDTLMGQSKSIIVDEQTKVAKDEVKDEDTTKWSALRDDFMMGAKMKDWDKESVDE